ncbi:ATP-binding protein [Rhizobium pusense]|nr:ATP-binding protein [Agrobacterium pusense]MBW9079555.1 ATP-binding protein [Agrobacterium pusense]
MKISEVILEKISKSLVLDAYVKSAVSKIASHISSNSMVFFPEYTDHDITHFEAVLETAIDLATDKSLELMSDVDLAVLTTSVMLHDLGMHITKDGFQTLIDPRGRLTPIDGFADPPWNELWLTFLAEARRFNAQKLEDLFGPHYRPVTKFPSFTEPWDEFDVLLVGEFLRRHHPRLAHEIAVLGMPSKDGEVLQFCGAASEQEKFLSDMSGLVARSHGMALRQTFSYLEKKYNNKIETRSVHPVYLMTLLRVADYLQIQSARAPSARTDVTKFKSPVSTREWSVHRCVTDITNLTDPEAIDITANPDNIETFLRLQYWITDLQKELDLSWAVLGEIYGLQAHSGLNKLGLRIRRLRSNIDAVSEFAKTVSYIPEKVSFTTAGSDLLKLLVGPLYANEVSVGLRELIQNATDAVKELDNLVDQGFIARPEPRHDVSADVQVDFVTETNHRDGWNRRVKAVTITDRGVGMTSEILQNYFLKAGASFRNSTAWKESFEKNDGSSRIQRSGRFGVGALAAFLLGDEISVETRHYSERSES